MTKQVTKILFDDAAKHSLGMYVRNAKVWQSLYGMYRYRFI